MSSRPISLKIKILVLVLVTILMTMGMSTWVSLQTQDDILRDIGQKHSQVLAETAHDQVVALMSSHEHDKLHALLRQVQRQNSLEKLYIFNDEGKILHSSNPEDVGAVLPVNLSKQFLASTDKAIVVSAEGVFNSIKTIHNQQECHTCHDPAVPDLGHINATFSLSYLDQLKHEGYQTSLLTFVSLMVVAVSAISAFFYFYVENPLRLLIRSMSRLEGGDFEEASLEVDSSREMHQIARKFNNMARHLQELIATKVNQEKELVMQQEQLAHQQELRAMNLTLEERLKEIEYLNLTLEERIEEIEDANYKIADLAGELESKNTSLEQTVKRLSALYKMGLALNATMDLGALFPMLLNKSIATLKARIGYILLLDGDQSHLRLAAASGMPTEIPPDFNIQIKPGGVSHWVLENKQPLLITSIEEAEGFSRRSLLGYERETVMCAPLMIKGEVIGTLSIANREDGSRFNAEDLEMVSTIAAQASIAINNARLYEEQQRTYLSTVQALVSAIEASDAYTRGHSERVTRYAMAIAEEMGISGPRLRLLEQAAILHDIGKIGIDLALLHKKGKLTNEEIVNLRKHPEIGRHILEPIHFLCQTSSIVAQHHERHDGTGYPHGLPGEDILLEARILSVADTFDAITSNRPYRDARLRLDAISEIRENSGTQFDPEVVRAFLRVFDSEAAA